MLICQESHEQIKEPKKIRLRRERAGVRLIEKVEGGETEGIRRNQTIENLGTATGWKPIQVQ